MSRTLNIHVRTYDIETVRNAVEEIWDDDYQVAVGAALGWVGVFPDRREQERSWREHARELSALTNAPVLSFLASGETVKASLHTSGQLLGQIDWHPQMEPARLEFLFVELGHWKTTLTGAQTGEESVEAGWLEPEDALSSMAAWFGVRNVESTFEMLLERGDLAVSGWENFRARIDGEWMQLAERRWVEPEIWTPESLVPFSALETSELEFDELEGPVILLDAPGTEVEPGASFPVQILLVSNTAIEIQDVILRLSGEIDEGEPQHWEASVEVGQAMQLAPDEPLTLTAMLTVPEMAVVQSSESWRVQVTATMADERLLTAEKTIDVVGPNELLSWEEDEITAPDTDMIAAGDAARLDGGPALVLPDVTVRWKDGLYHVEAIASSPPDDLAVEEDITGADGRFARMLIGDGRLTIQFALRPAAAINLGKVREILLGTPPYDFVVDAYSDAVGLTPLERWDQIHRRVLAAWARQVAQDVSEGEESSWIVLGEQVGAIMHAVSEDSGTLRRMIRVLRLLADREGTGSIEAVLVGTVEQWSESESNLSQQEALNVARVREKLDAGDLHGAIDLANAAIAAYQVDASYYEAIGEACMELGFAMRENYARRTAFFEWEYPEPYRERASGLRRRMERALRCALWIEPTAGCAALLARGLKHPLDAMTAWQSAVELAPDEPRYSLQMARAIVAVDAADPGSAIKLASAIEKTGPDEGEVSRLYVEALQIRLLGELARAFEGGTPSYLHYGLAGDPLPVTPAEGALGRLREACDALEEVSTDDWPKHAESAWLAGQARSLIAASEGTDEEGVGLNVARLLTEVARRTDSEALGRIALAVALRGRYEERDLDRLVARSRICQRVFAFREADELLETARAFGSRSLLPVLDAEIDFLAERGHVAAARELAVRLLRIAPEQSRRAESLFDTLLEQGELDQAESLFVYYLREVPGSSVVRDRLVDWAKRLARVYATMDDLQRAVRPIEWLLFLGGELSEEQEDELRKARDELATASASFWPEQSEEGLEQ